MPTTWTLQVSFVLLFPFHCKPRSLCLREVTISCLCCTLSGLFNFVVYMLWMRNELKLRLDMHWYFVAVGRFKHSAQLTGEQVLLTKHWLITVRYSTNTCKLHVCTASWLVWQEKRLFFFPNESFGILKVFHPHWVLCCSQSHGFWFIYLFFSPFPRPGGKTHSLPGALAFCMAYAWLGELIPHTLLTQSGLDPCVFIIHELCLCVIHAQGFLCFLCVSPVLSLCCLYFGFIFSWLLPNILLSLPLPTLSSFSPCTGPLCLRCFRWHP